MRGIITQRTPTFGSTHMPSGCLWQDLCRTSLSDQRCDILGHGQLDGRRKRRRTRLQTAIRRADRARKHVRRGVDRQRARPARDVMQETSACVTNGLLHSAFDHRGFARGFLQRPADAHLEVHDHVLRRRSPLSNRILSHADGVIHLRLHVSRVR